MVHTLCGEVCRVSGLRGCESAQMEAASLRAFQTQARLPALAALRDTKKARGVGLGKPRPVVLIRGCRHVTKIRGSVVASLPVDVVDHFCRPSAPGVQPDNPVREVGQAVYADEAVAVRLNPTRYVASSNSAARFDPKKRASLGNEIEQMSDTISSERQPGDSRYSSHVSLRTVCSSLMALAFTVTMASYMERSTQIFPSPTHLRPAAWSILTTS